MKLLRQKDVMKATGLSRMTIWRLERAGQFPQRRRLGPNAVGWIQAEIDDWIATRPAARLSVCKYVSRSTSSTAELRRVHRSSQRRTTT